jgi:hypothetical protein
MKGRSFGWIIGGFQTIMIDFQKQMSRSPTLAILSHGVLRNEGRRTRSSFGIIFRTFSRHMLYTLTIDSTI